MHCKSKEEFLKLLSFCTQEDLNKIILEKGKPPKLIKPIIYLGK